MTKKELDEMKNIHDMLVTSEIMEAEDAGVNLPIAEKFNPHEDIENTLTDFLKTRLKKLESDQMFELAVKNNLMTRISEANVPQLIQLLDVVQKNSNAATTGVLQPFISQTGESTLLDRRQKQLDALGKVEETLFNKADKNTLQGFDELKRLMGAMSTAQAMKDG